MIVVVAKNGVLHEIDCDRVSLEFAYAWMDFCSARESPRNIRRQCDECGFTQGHSPDCHIEYIPEGFTLIEVLEGEDEPGTKKAP